MYKTMKILITNKFYETACEAQNKVDVFYAVNRLTDAEYAELSLLIENTYVVIEDQEAEETPAE